MSAKKKAVDLFCGAGGTSAGYLAACRALGVKPDLLAINHWPVAIATHELNHRGVRHLCETLDKINPRDAIPSRHLHLLAASPECTHHSNAAGGRPRNEQSRATAWHVCRWVNDIHVDAFMIENVREFMNWGPLRKNGKPMKRYRGQTFKAFLQSLASLGYNIEHRILNAADFGDPTTRERLIIIGRRGNKPLLWPAQTHARNGLNGLKPWRAAREIIDWDLKGKSIFSRKKPLSQNTLRRIAAGIRKFGGVHAEPFLVMLYGTNDARSLDRPLPTVTAGGGHIGLARPFVLPNEGIGRGNAPRSIDDPLNTVTAARGAGALVEPFVIKYHGSHEGRADGDGRVYSADQPLGTLDTSNRFGIVEPFVVHTNHHGGDRCHSPANPLPTVTGGHRGEMALVEPFMIHACHGEGEERRCHSVDNPAPTVTGSNELALVDPFITPISNASAGPGCVRSVDDPAYTVMTEEHLALVEPFVVKYYGTGGANSLRQPLDTVTTRDRFLLVEPRTGRAVAELDIFFRMLQPHELAGAQGFPRDYQFTGNREDRVKQIGNAVPVNLATAICKSLLS